MNRHYTFYMYVTLMVVLSISMPSLILAEQHQAENIIAIAKYDAERDVNHDVNKQNWFMAGMVPVCLGSTITVLVLDTESHEMPPVEFLNCISPLVGPVSALFSSPSPPTERFIGKSPEYISAYTDTYKSKARSIRMTSASRGVATGCGLSIAGCMLYLLQSDFIDDFSLGPTF